MDGGHILILGGTRSGKSALAESIALETGNRPACIATAEAGDGAMEQRIELHRKLRDKSFTTYEQPLELAKTIEKTRGNHDVILVDCLGMWLSNLTFAKNVSKPEKIKQLKDMLANTDDCRIIMVSSEVGLGGISPNRLARQFDDEIGLLNQELARICSNVYLSVAGLPLPLKGQLPKS